MKDIHSEQQRFLEAEHLYVLMFSIPLPGRGESAPWSVRIAAVSGLLTTLLYLVLSIFPVMNVANPLGFTVKVGGTVLAVNVAGTVYFAYASRRIRGSSATL